MRGSERAGRGAVSVKGNGAQWRQRREVTREQRSRAGEVKRPHLPNSLGAAGRGGARRGSAWRCRARLGASHNDDPGGPIADRRRIVSRPVARRLETPGGQQLHRMAGACRPRPAVQEPCRPVVRPALRTVPHAEPHGKTGEPPDGGSASASPVRTLRISSRWPRLNRLPARKGTPGFTSGRWRRSQTVIRSKRGVERSGPQIAAYV